MSKNEEKTTAEQVEQAVPAATPEAVEEQAVQAESETAAEAAARPAAPAETHEDPATERSKIVVSDPRGLNLREGPHVSYAARAVLSDGAPVEILDLPKDVEVPGWALVETGAGIGWVNTNFLSEAEA